MNKVQKLIVSMKVVIHLWKLGFFFSENTHKDKKEHLLGEYWGFYRLNFDNGKKKEFAIVDFDFAEKIDDERINFMRIHNLKTIFRVDNYVNGDCVIKLP